MATTLIRDMYAALMVRLETAAGSPTYGLGISMILGEPDTSRAIPTIPIGALSFQYDHYASQPSGVRPRVGQVPATGSENHAVLMMYADGERGLLELVESLRQTKQRVASVEVDSVTFVVRWGPTERFPYAGEERTFMFAAQCGLSFGWNE